MGETQTVNQTKKDFKPLIKLISWIVGAVGAVALLISIISLIVLGSKDYTKNKKYVYEESFMGMAMKVELTLKKDGKFTEIANIMGEVEDEEGKYYVSGGKLYVDYAWDDDTIDDAGFEEYGKISATKIAIEDAESGMSVAMVCKSAKTQKNVSIVFVVIGSILVVVGAATLVVTDYLSKKDRIIIEQTTSAQEKANISNIEESKTQVVEQESDSQE